MAKKQTRRSISVSRSFYDTLKVFAAQDGRSMSQIMEDAGRVAIATAIDPKLGRAFDKLQNETRAASEAKA